MVIFNMSTPPYTYFTVTFLIAGGIIVGYSGRGHCEIYELRGTTYYTSNLINYGDYRAGTSWHHRRTNAPLLRCPPTPPWTSTSLNGMPSGLESSPSRVGFAVLFEELVDDIHAHIPRRGEGRGR
jgi:hypothetical protein